MIVYNTRFNPTTNGPLHIGHLYMIKVNEWVAHQAAVPGKFIMRFDDNQTYYDLMMSHSAQVEISKQMREDVEWAGVKVDEWTSQKMQEHIVEEFISRFNKGPLQVKNLYQHRDLPHILGEKIAPYPYAPYLTAEKVILDTIDYITWLIRGKDLLNEFSLYSYFCEIWNFTNPKHVYLPRLMTAEGSEMVENPTNVSKTLGGWSIREFRNKGWRPDELVEKLAVSCLVNPDNGWDIENIKENPVWKQ